MLNEDGPLAYGDPEVISLQKSPQTELPSPDWIWIIHFQFRGLRGSPRGSGLGGRTLHWSQWLLLSLQVAAEKRP